MKKLLFGFVISFTAMSASATEFSFERSYNLKMPINSQRIGAIVELRDYFEVNPEISGIASQINNLSFQYKGFSKANVKSKICFRVGKLDFFKERLDKASKRVFSSSVPRLLNEGQSKIRDQFDKLNGEFGYKLKELKSFCDGDLKLNDEGVRAVASGLSSLIHDTASNINWALDKDSLLTPQNSDLFIEYTGALRDYKNEDQATKDGEKKCSIRDIF